MYDCFSQPHREMRFGRANGVGIDWCDVLRAGSIAGGKRNI